MIKDSPIVEDTRRVHRMLSEKFDHDIGRYIAYLQSEATSRQAKKAVQRANSSEGDTTKVKTTSGYIRKSV